MPLLLNTNKCNYAQMSQNNILLHCTIEITQEDISLQFESHIFCGCEKPYLDDFLQQRLVWEALERQRLPKYGKLCHSGWKTWNIALSHRLQISWCGLILGSGQNSTTLLRGIWIGCRFRPDEICFVQFSLLIRVLTYAQVSLMILITL